MRSLVRSRRKCPELLGNSVSHQCVKFFAPAAATGAEPRATRVAEKVPRNYEKSSRLLRKVCRAEKFCIETTQKLQGSSGMVAMKSLLTAMKFLRSSYAKIAGPGIRGYFFDYGTSVPYFDDFLVAFRDLLIHYMLNRFVTAQKGLIGLY